MSGKIILFADTVVKRGSFLRVLESVTMALYSLLLGSVLLVGSPYWLWRAARGGADWRADLLPRLGRVPHQLRKAIAGRQVVWVHAVSVGEVLAATRLVAELERALGEGWRIVLSTTTATGQALAKKRFAVDSSAENNGESGGSAHVFYYPLDFAWCVRSYLRAVKPKLLVLMESELWPRMLLECGRAEIPVAVVNARVSDRSYTRAMCVHALWRHLLRQVPLFLTQSVEDARRLVKMGAWRGAVEVVGNLKYDAAEPKTSAIAQRLDNARTNAKIIIAGSTLEGEEQMVLAAWPRLLATDPNLILVIAPRHPERFEAVQRLIAARGYSAVLGTELQQQPLAITAGTVLILNTIGDLAAVYASANIAFIGGSLVQRGGHNPLEPARFGVPVIIGPSYENFRDIVGKLQADKGIRIVQDAKELQSALIQLLTDLEPARAMGERGRQVFEQQQGATQRTVAMLLQLMDFSPEPNMREITQ